MTTPPTIPLSLRAARRSVCNVPGLELLSDWQWHDPPAVWAFRCRITVDVPAGNWVPASTEWYVTVSPRYPWGSVKVYPANERGLTLTFQHQNCNVESAKFPWRLGDLCLSTTVRVLGRHGFDSEPQDASGPFSRLRWHLLRAADWLRAAATGTLAHTGDPFEVPHFWGVNVSPIVVAFSEDAYSFAVWQGINERFGIADFSVVAANRELMVVRTFLNKRGKELLPVSWGSSLSNPSEARQVGIWIRLTEPPVLPVWQTPLTWRDLRMVCHRQRVQLDDILRKTFWVMQDKKPHILLVGFPFPATVGGPHTQMHWQATRLTEIGEIQDWKAGFRKGYCAKWAQAKDRVTSNASPIRWLDTQNWTAGELVSRGRLPEPITSKRVLLIGAGALGSVIAEMLVRAGTYKLTVLDGEKLLMGNLCRHTLGIPELQHGKAEGLTKRVAQFNPHTEVEAIPETFPPLDTDALAKVEASDIILDCTAEDEVLHHLSVFPWKTPKQFASLSLGFAAKRLFCFVAEGAKFPASEFGQAIRPWMAREKSEHGHKEMPREALGCWHPIFPARVDDVWMMATVAVKQLEATLTSKPVATGLTVYEQQTQGNTFVGVVKATLEGGP